MQCDNGAQISDVHKRFNIKPSEIIKQGYENAGVRISQYDLAVKIQQFERFNAIDLEVSEYCRLLLSGELKV